MGDGKRQTATLRGPTGEEEAEQEDASLGRIEIAKLLHESPSATHVPPTSLAPYLAAPPGLSAEAYQEWLERVCKQPAD
jgi:hypothetical protein